MVSPQYQPAAQETGQPCETCGAQSGTERGVLLVNKQGIDETFILNGAPRRGRRPGIAPHAALFM